MGGCGIIATGNNLHEFTEFVKVKNINGGQYEDKKNLSRVNADYHGIVQHTAVR
jgi:hypothetical protein